MHCSGMHRHITSHTSPCAPLMVLHVRPYCPYSMLCVRCTFIRYRPSAVHMRHHWRHYWLFDRLPRLGGSVVSWLSAPGVSTAALQNATVRATSRARRLLCDVAVAQQASVLYWQRTMRTTAIVTAAKRTSHKVSCMNHY